MKFEHPIKMRAFFYNEKGLLFPCRELKGSLHPKGIMHDLFHHFPNDKGTLEEELLAIGALLYVFNQDFRNIAGKPYDPLRLAEDLCPLMSYRKLQYILPKKIQDKDDSSLLLDIKKELYSQYANGYSTCYEQYKMQKVTNAINWVRAGYNRAKRRYQYMDRHLLTYNYYEMLYEVTEKVAKRIIRSNPEYIEVNLNIKEGKVNVVSHPYLLMDSNELKIYSEEGTIYGGHSYQESQRIYDLLQIGRNSALRH